MRTAIAPSAARATAFEPAVLRANRLFESQDLDDTRERISRVMQPHHLRPLGRPEGGRSHMDFLRLGGIGVGTIDFGEAMRVDVEHVEDYHLLMFCLRGSAQARAGERALQVDAHHGMICAPGARFVADLSADFYLETVERVFQTFDLLRGELTFKGRRVNPAAIRRTALLTVEGERDDICSVGQTLAAQELASSIKLYMRTHYIQPNVGHYGVFSGRRWQHQVYPMVRHVIQVSQP